MATGSSVHRIPAIDLLRAVAVLSVIIYHLNERYLPGGFAGVDVFFVISGYVVTRSLASRVDLRWHRYLTEFYARRILRIFPALTVCLLITMFAEAMFVPEAWLSSQNYQTAMHAFVGLSNVFLSNSRESYFAPRVGFNPYLHTWSLGVEEQFYLLLPLVYFVQRRLVPGQRTNWRRHLLFVLVVASLGICIAYSNADPATAYYSLASRFWELGVGALLAEHHRMTGENARDSRITWAWPLLIGSTMLLMIGLVVSDRALFPFPYALFAVAGTLGIIDVAVRSTLRVPANNAVDVGLYVGLISYSLYLWHWPVLALFRWTVGLEAWWLQLAALGVIGVSAVASFHFVERSFQTQWFAARGRGPVVIVGSLTIAVAMLAGSQVEKHRARVSLSVTRDARAWYPYNWSVANEKTGGCAGTRKAQPFHGGQQITLSRSGCGTALHGAQTLFVAGDSHAGAYETMLAEVAVDTPYDVRIFLFPGCPFFPLRTPMAMLPPTCSAFVAAALQEIASIAKPTDVLFLPSLRLKRLGGQFGDSEAESIPRSPTEQVRLQSDAVTEARVAISSVERSGARIVFEAPKPIFKSPAFRCSDWFNQRNPDCAGGLEESAESLMRLRQPIVESLAALAVGETRISVWDPFPVLCPGKTCTAVDAGVPLFFDGNHLSGEGNRRLKPSFEQMLSSPS